jgi:3',5'-cyclic AMP phosphodiesterase CpdA
MKSFRAFALPLVLLVVACSQIPPAPPPPPLDQAAAPAGALFRFAAYGDTRDNHDIHRAIVAGVMSFQPALVLQTGDLVRDGGDAGQWQIFDEITADMRRRISYYPARGNHDVGTHYEKRVTEPVKSGTKLYYSFEKGDVHFIALDTEDSLPPGSVQRQWLEADLAKAKSEGKFIIPFFHKAIFSIGRHAIDKDVLALRKILDPLFQAHGVRLAFLGHDHQYYRTVRGSITYVITGGGGAPLYGDDHREFRIQGDVYESVNHFCVADVYPDRVVVTAYRRNLSQLDRFEVPMALVP